MAPTQPLVPFPGPARTNLPLSLCLGLKAPSLGWLRLDPPYHSALEGKHEAFSSGVLMGFLRGSYSRAGCAVWATLRAALGGESHSVGVRQGFNERLVNAQHCGRCWRHTSDQDRNNLEKTPALWNCRSRRIANVCTVFAFYRAPFWGLTFMSNNNPSRQLLLFLFCTWGNGDGES